MTSMQFFHRPELPAKVYPEWGTGKDKDEKPHLWTPAPPTWQYSGEPIMQHYDLTALKRSNVRLSDQLLPTPQTSRMQDHLIHMPFPAEHPYASHMERKAVFPKFDSPQDPKRGVRARRQMPKDPEMPANAYDTIVVSKVKGNALRREIQALPPETLKRPLEWHENNFYQLVKSGEDGKQPYYPWPPKTLVPNLEERGAGDVSARTANGARNVEKEQWTTTYDRNHTGLGPTNAYSLDNLEDKLPGGDDGIKARAVRTFEPARPFEGRIHRQMVPAPQPDPSFPGPSRNPNYTRVMVPSEIEEYRLWNGTPYLSLPLKDDEPDNTTPQPTEEEAEKEQSILQQQLGLSAHHQQQQPVSAAVAVSDDFLLQQQQQEPTTSAGASLTTADNLQILRHKMALTNTKSQPPIFYEHDGGHSVATETPAERFDISTCHRDALNLDVSLNQEIHEALRYNRTLGDRGSVPRLHAQPTSHEMLTPLQIARRTTPMPASARGGDVTMMMMAPPPPQTPASARDARRERLPPDMAAIFDSTADAARPHTAPDNNSRRYSRRYSYQQDAAATGEEQQNHTPRLDLGYKNDGFFTWPAGSPRPQTRLLEIQNSFTKTDAKRDFLENFPEQNPDLRQNIYRGKRHNFDGFNAQVLRGTPVH